LPEITLANDTIRQHTIPVSLEFSNWRILERAAGRSILAPPVKLDSYGLVGDPGGAGGDAGAGGGATVFSAGAIAEVAGGGFASGAGAAAVDLA